MQNISLTHARFALTLTLLALLVIVLGAYVRLSDAGLGCPDWPGCYGNLIAPTSEVQIASANSAYPAHPVEVEKAWKEMVHRYLAGVLGLATLFLAVLSIRNRNLTGQPHLLIWLLVLVVALQAVLGMWTVTLLVKPAIVTSHLLGGFIVAALLWTLTLRLYSPTLNRYVVSRAGRLLWFSRIGLVVLLLQILLGGWTSTNYATIGCTEFPTCHSGSWWPNMDFSQAFTLWHGTGINYEYGIISAEARTAIHMTHRIGALITAAYLLFLSIYLCRTGRSVITRQLAWAVGILLILQLGLGITNAVSHLPLPVAAAHNGIAVLLLLTLLTLNWQLKRAYRME
ncbi:COX15/CtaA family protein [Sedimenticola selenatireducens]|uniref:Cytochrome B n=1 Tax=Sedimenticola selenatireducens TaxID=191960 RepID=A0A2N6CWQ2_9GAMM|nr:COX15/CtaA family protein [Sedimenticola selenatireducens]PLX61712.1 MAG: cytochrome B [Sedimenticola selenatireducens]